MNELLLEFQKDIRSLFGAFEFSKVVDNSGKNDHSSYPESMLYIGEGVGKEDGQVSSDLDDIGEFKNGRWETVGGEFRKVNACGKSAVGLRGRITNDLFFKFIHCYRWMCEGCGSKGGRINKRRFANIIKKLNETLFKNRFGKSENNIFDLGDGNLDLRQLILTVPKEWRKQFQTREDITALCRIAERVFKKSFPGLPSIRYFHAFGDKERGVYNPHVNIHGFEITKKILSITPAELNKIREDWAWGLMGYLSAKRQIVIKKEFVREMNVHYSFVESDKIYKRKKWNKEERKYEMVDIEGLKLLIHRIEYMARPCPGADDLQAIKQDKDLLKLFVVKMKGFRYVTNCGFWSVKDQSARQDIIEAQNLAGEPLKLEYDKEGKVLYITRGFFDLKYRYWDYEELSEGFYRIKSGVINGNSK